MTREQRIRWLFKPAVFIFSLVPLAMLFWWGFSDGLGANPVETITRHTGEWGLRFLIITLCVTPLRKLSGWNPLIRFRRMLGLFAFFYLTLHFLTYLVLDAEFSLAYIVEDIVERLYITAGFTGFCLLIPLALTSTNGMVRRLGGKRWQRLHRLVYPAVLAGCLHYLWLVKADLREPLIYTGIALFLLALRIPVVERRLAAWRQPAARAGATDTAG
ncbi:MAG: protein-methionine-sulfoxide reductase heme-binding subunit MsrQ [Gammaproteobacteria bacterium]|nr:protein-methionine-sulfoxide reductase heme-binding subunit MsrQ [Gammaproteobacteria bacterium]